MMTSMPSLAELRVGVDAALVGDAAAGLEREHIVAVIALLALGFELVTAGREHTHHVVARRFVTTGADIRLPIPRTTAPVSMRSGPADGSGPKVPNATDVVPSSAAELAQAERRELAAGLKRTLGGG